MGLQKSWMPKAISRIGQRFRKSSWVIKAQRFWFVFWFETTIPIALSLMLLASIITYIWWRFANLDVNDLWPEMGGMVLDIVFILVIFGAIQHRRERREQIRRQQEIIDDFKRWNNKEGRLRIAGAIRRLNRLGITKIEFAGLTLSKLRFAEAGIGSLEGSVFYDGKWGQRIGDSRVKLSEVEFDNMNLDSVTFSPSEPLRFLGANLMRHAQFKNCSFRDASLHKAKFDGATLEWSEVPPASRYEFYPADDDNEAFSIQTSYGPFDRTDLEGVSFAGCHFVNADFRGASGIAQADFAEATGLEEGFFDDEIEKAAVLESVNNKITQRSTGEQS